METQNTPNTGLNDAARRNLLQIATKQGRSFAYLSATVLKKNRAYLSQFVDNGSPKVLPLESRLRLAAELGVSEAAFNPATAEEWSKNPVYSPPALTAITTLPELTARTIKAAMQPAVADVDLETYFPVELKAGLLPVFGMVHAGDGSMTIAGTPEGWVDRPGILRGATDAFGLRVRGESMFPKYAPGDMVMINPRKAPVAGCYVVVALHSDGDEECGLIKQFVKQTPDEIILRQFNPDKEIRCNRANITSLGVVVGNIEGR